MCPWVCCLHPEDGSLVSLLNRRRASDGEARSEPGPVQSARTDTSRHRRGVPGGWQPCFCSGSGKVKTYVWVDLGGEGQPARGPVLARGGQARYGNGTANGGRRNRSRRPAVAACFFC